MKFMLLLCMLIISFSLNTAQCNNPGLSGEGTNEMGKNIPDHPFVKYEQILISEPVNDNHFIISAIIPHWETICK